MNSKTSRAMKVYSGNTKDYKPVAQIRLQGKWLEELGFVPGTPLNVSCENGKLVIVKAI